MKRFAAATARNREPLAAVLERELPVAGTVLEVASGTGEHAAYFAGRFASLVWQPSDSDPAALASIEAWREDSNRPNLRSPTVLDARDEEWPISTVGAVLCVNMLHIAPWSACEGLFAGSGRALVPNGPLIVYGPFLEPAARTAATNRAFDRTLRSRNEAWGLRSTDRLDELAVRAGLQRVERYAMPANNLLLVWRKRD